MYVFYDCSEIHEIGMKLYLSLVLITLPKLDWVALGVISSSNGCLFSFATLGNSATFIINDNILALSTCD